MPVFLKTLFKGFLPDLPTPLNDSEWRVIMLLHHMEGLPMKEYVLGMALNKGTLSRIVDKLVNKGYIQRLSRSLDRRIVVLNLTQRGKALAEKLEYKLTEHVDKKLSCLSIRERAQFNQAIECLFRITQKINSTENLA